jgi:hypothetical protein
MPRRSWRASVRMYTRGAHRRCLRRAVDCRRARRRERDEFRVPACPSPSSPSVGRCAFLLLSLCLECGGASSLVWSRGGSRGAKKKGRTTPTVNTIATNGANAWNHNTGLIGMCKGGTSPRWRLRAASGRISLRTPRLLVRRAAETGESIDAHWSPCRQAQREVHVHREHRHANVC